MAAAVDIAGPMKMGTRGAKGRPAGADPRPHVSVGGRPPPHADGYAHGRAAHVGAAHHRGGQGREPGGRAAAVARRHQRAPAQRKPETVGGTSGSPGAAAGPPSPSARPAGGGAVGGGSGASRTPPHPAAPPHSPRTGTPRAPRRWCRVCPLGLPLPRPPRPPPHRPAFRQPPPARLQTLASWRAATRSPSTALGWIPPRRQGRRCPARRHS